jgi:hypothetical protein
VHSRRRSLRVKCVPVRAYQLRVVLTCQSFPRAEWGGADAMRASDRSIADVQRKPLQAGTVYTYDTDRTSARSLQHMSAADRPHARARGDSSRSRSHGHTHLAIGDCDCAWRHVDKKRQLGRSGRHLTSTWRPVYEDGLSRIHGWRCTSSSIDRANCIGRRFTVVGARVSSTRGVATTRVSQPCSVSLTWLCVLARDFCCDTAAFFVGRFEIV